MNFNGHKIELGVHCFSRLAIDLGGGKLDLLVGEEDGGVIYYPREQLTWVDMRFNQ